MPALWLLGATDRAIRLPERFAACFTDQRSPVHIEHDVRTLDGLSELIDWQPISCLLAPLYPARKGEAGWPPLAMFKALLLAMWHDLSDVKLAEALDGRASFCRFCGFARQEATPERTAFVRFRQLVVARGLDGTLFDAITT